MVRNGNYNVGQGVKISPEQAKIRREIMLKKIAERKKQQPAVVSAK